MPFLSNIEKNNVSISLLVVVVSSALLLMFPDQSTYFLQSVNNLFVGRGGVYYRIFGFAVFAASLYFALSKYGKIRIGKIPNPKYSLWKWGAMVFTSTMAADLLYWSLIEWAYYYNDFADNRAMWAATLPLFHWGPIPWSFYLLPAAAFGYMLYSIKGGGRQRFSEACRPVLKNSVDKFPGKVIDVLALVALIAATSTTFSIATPLLNELFCRLSGLPSNNMTTLVIFIVITSIYTLAVCFDLKGISRLATVSVFCFCTLLIVIFLTGPTKFITQTGILSFKNLIVDFIPLSLKDTHRWTTFYWAYWLVWCVGTPFFIGKISEGRTVRQVILQGYLFGLAGTFISFIILGYCGLYLQQTGKMDIANQLSVGVLPPDLIVGMIKQTRFPTFLAGLLLICMIAFYATTLDVLVLVGAEYSIKNCPNERPNIQIRLFWVLLLIVLPIAFISLNSSLVDLQTVSIIASFPISLIIILIIISFYLSLKRHKTINH